MRERGRRSVLVAHEPADDKADAVLLDVYSSQARPSRAMRATEATGPQVPAG